MRLWCGHCKRHHDSDDGTCPVVAARTVQERVRTLLIERFGRVPAADLASALAYEMTSILATGASTVQDGLDALNGIHNAMRDQLRQFGVGRPHP